MSMYLNRILFLLVLLVINGTVSLVADDAHLTVMTSTRQVLELLVEVDTFNIGGATDAPFLIIDGAQQFPSGTRVVPGLTFSFFIPSSLRYDISWQILDSTLYPARDWQRRQSFQIDQQKTRIADDTVSEIFDDNWVELNPPARVEGYPIATGTIRLARYDESKGEAIIIRRMRITVTYQFPAQLTPGLELPLPTSLRKIALNPDCRPVKIETEPKLSRIQGILRAWVCLKWRITWHILKSL